MFKKKKPLAKHENIKMTGAHDKQMPVDFEKIKKESQRGITIKKKAKR